MWRNLKTRLINMHLFKKIGCIYITLTVISMTVLFSIQYSYMMPIISDYEKMLEKRSYDDLNEYMDRMYRNLVGVIENFYNNKRVYQGIKEINQQNEKLNDMAMAQLFDEFGSSISIAGNDIVDLIIITNHNDVIYRSGIPNRRISSAYDFSKDTNVIKVRKEKLKQGIFCGNSSQYIMNEQLQTLSFMGVISDTDNLMSNSEIGVFIINIPFSAIEKSFEKNRKYLKGNLSVANMDNQIIFSTNSEFVGETFAELKNVENQDGSGIQLGKEQIVQTKLLRKPDVRVINSMQEHFLKKQLNKITVYMLVALGIIISIFCILITIFSRMFNLRLSLMVNRMRAVQEGDFQVQIPIGAMDEMGELSAIFNEMCLQLDKHIKQVYQAEIEQKKFEIMALQSQINPHFLFNTLECIRMKAVIDNQYELGEMISALGKLFRRSVKSKNKLVSIQDEIEYITSYLELMQFRYGEALEYYIKVPKEIYSYGIPKLSLQPIVENAIMHGIHTSGEGNIMILAKRSENKIEIEISDSGVGISEKNMETIRQDIYDENLESDKGNYYKIGLRNVHRRIVMLFGEEHGVTISSIEGKGTSVKVIIPVLEKEEFF